MADMMATNMPMVPTARKAPLIERSSWVTPCCTRSPMVTSRMSWKAESSASWRLPIDRVTSQTKKKIAVARTMISMGLRSLPSGEVHGCCRVVVVEDGDGAVVDAHVLGGFELGAEADGKRVARRRVELPGDRLVARRRLLRIGDEIVDVEDVEVVARHADRHRPLEAALLLDLDLDWGVDAGPAGARIGDLELIAVRRGRCLARASAEQVQGADHEEGYEQQQTDAPEGA